MRWGMGSGVWVWLGSVRGALGVEELRRGVEEE